MIEMRWNKYEVSLASPIIIIIIIIIIMYVSNRCTMTYCYDMIDMTIWMDVRVSSADTRAIARSVNGPWSIG